MKNQKKVYFSTIFQESNGNTVVPQIRMRKSEENNDNYFETIEYALKMSRIGMFLLASK